MHVLIIGAGGIGKRHIRGYLKTGRAEVFIVEPDREKRIQVLSDYDLSGGYAELDDADLEVFDAAVICAPAHLHVPLATRCAEAGLHFLCEKPLSVDMNGVDELVDLVDEKGLEVRVGYVRRSSEETVQFKRRLDEGEIGEIRMCYINASQEYPKYRPDYREIYYADAQRGGGAILDCASHMFDLLLWIMGSVTEVSAMYDHLEIPDVDVEDAALISLRFASGGMAQIDINQFQKPNVCTIEMVGTEGNLILDSVSGEIRYAHDDSGEWAVDQVLDPAAAMDVHENRFAKQANMFMDAIEGGSAPLATLQEARENLRIALAAKKSYREKRIVPLA